jgi:Zn-dependent peptidase ImmA (M78 family)
LRIRSKEIESDNSIETFCDKFAAAFLVPADIIFSRPEIEQIQQQIKDEDAIRSLANLFKVSRQVIILRLLLAKKITREYYDAKKRKFDIEFTIFLKKKREREKKSKGGPLPHILSVSEHGKLFSRTVVSAFREGKISSKDASTYLGVKLNYIPHIESIL